MATAETIEGAKSSVNRETRPFLYPEQPPKNPEQDLCDPNNPSNENCNLFQIENGKVQNAFTEPEPKKTPEPISDTP